MNMLLINMNRLKCVPLLNKVWGLFQWGKTVLTFTIFCTYLVFYAKKNMNKINFVSKFLQTFNFPRLYNEKWTNKKLSYTIPLRFENSSSEHFCILVTADMPRPSLLSISDAENCVLVHLKGLDVFQQPMKQDFDIFD